MAENFPESRNETDIWVEEALRIPYKMNPIKNKNKIK